MSKPIPAKSHLDLDDDPPGCPHCGAIAGACDSYPNCPGGKPDTEAQALLEAGERKDLVRASFLESFLSGDDQAESNARDAERYRWLRDEIARGDVPRSYMPHWMDKIAYPADFDSAIDAARREGDENG